MQPHIDHSDKLKKRKFKKMKQMITEKLQNINDEETSDSEQVDLSVDLHPIKHYIDDKEEMIEQMFTSLGSTLIQNMLPPMLRPVPVHELKADCLIQLLGMSKKRIFTSIEGKELQSSSDSDIDSDDSPASEKKSVKTRKHHVSKAAKHKYIIDTDTLNVSIDNEDDLGSLSLSEEETMKGRKRKSMEKIKKSKSKHSKLGTNSLVLNVGDTSPISISSDEASDQEKSAEKDSVGPKKGQTLLEILELEMRAKAIRSLLKQGPSSSPQPDKASDSVNRTSNNQAENLFDPNVKVKTEPSDPDVVEIIELQPDPQPTNVGKSIDKPKEKELEAEKSVVAATAEEPALDPQKSVPAANTADVDSSKSVSDPVSKGSDKNDAKVQGPSWSERYLENKETEKLIKTSKMCTNIRKRMRLVRTMQQLQVKEKVEIPVVIGSISEYQQLVGSDSSNSAKEPTETAAPQTSETEAPNEVPANKDEPPVENSKSSSISNLEKSNDLVCSDILEIDIPDLDADSQPEAEVAQSVKVTQSAEAVQTVDEKKSDEEKTEAKDDDPEVSFVQETNINDIIIVIDDDEKENDEKENGKEEEKEEGEIDSVSVKTEDVTPEKVVSTERKLEENSVSNGNAES